MLFIPCLLTLVQSAAEGHSSLAKPLLLPARPMAQNTPSTPQATLPAALLTTVLPFFPVL